MLVCVAVAFFDFIGEKDFHSRREREEGGREGVFFWQVITGGIEIEIGERYFNGSNWDAITGSIERDLRERQ